MQKVGLTGNIGSGKTTVAKIFQSFGAAVFDADIEAKAAINEPAQQEKLINYFGDKILAENHKIDRRKFANLIFNDPASLQFVNDLIHPIVRQRFSGFYEKHSDNSLCIYEAAVLIETGFYRQLDKLILVTAPLEIRIQRVMDRDKISHELVIQRNKNQWDEALKIKHADFVIINDSTSPLLQHCLDVYAKLSGQKTEL